MTAFWRFLRLALSPSKGIPAAWDLRELALVVAGAVGLSGLTGFITTLLTSFVPGVAGAMAASALTVAGLFGWAGLRLQRRLDELKSEPRPNVVFDGFAPVRNQLVTVSRINQDPVAEFARLRFVNEPEHRGPGADVTNLHAFIEIRDHRDQRTILAVPDGRFADNPDRGEAPSRETKSVPLPGTLESRILDIVMQRRGEDECYGWDHNGFQIPEPAVPPGNYQVRVQLDGTNMEPRTFHFTLTNHGKEDFLELVEREGFKNPPSSRWLAAKRSTENTEAPLLP